MTKGFVPVEVDGAVAELGGVAASVETVVLPVVAVAPQYRPAEDATVLAWFENERPLSAKGRLALARALLARGDRANAERLVREAWRTDSMSEAFEEKALEVFGPLLAPGDQKARMDYLLYGREQDAARRPQRRDEVRMGRADEMGSGTALLPSRHRKGPA